MSASVALGLVMALLCAVVGLFGMLLKQRGAVEAPPVEWRDPLRSTWALFKHPAWTWGIIVATLGWGFHVAALSLAPISLGQAVIAGGLVLLTPIADRVFGLHVTKRDWIGVGIAATGLALLAGTLGDTAKSAHSDFDGATLAAYLGTLTAAAIACCILVLGDTPRAGVVLALASGVIWGVSDVTIKALSDSLSDDGVAILLNPMVLIVVVASLVGLVVSARSLQLGPAVSVIAITSVALNVVTIASGPIVFGEPLPDDPGALAIRLLAFALVVGGAAVTPGPRAPDAAPAPA